MHVCVHACVQCGLCMCAGGPGPLRACIDVGGVVLLLFPGFELLCVAAGADGGAVSHPLDL